MLCGINKEVKMATADAGGVISFYSIAVLFSGQEKLIKRGENAVRSGHVIEFGYDADVGRIYGRVEASMKSSIYSCEVPYGLFTKLCHILFTVYLFDGRLLR